MNAVTTMRPLGRTMTYRTHTEAAASQDTITLIAWCEAHGFRHEIQALVYYNLPDNRVPESMDDDPTRSPERYCELWADLPGDAAWPIEADLCTLGLDRDPSKSEAVQLDEIIAKRIHRAAEATDARQSRLEELLAKLPALVARDGRIVTGTLLADEMYARGGEWQELRSLARTHPRGLDLVRDRLRECQ